MRARPSRRPISRAVFPRVAGAALVLALVEACRSGLAPYDLLLVGGHVIDGTGSPAQRADVGIAGDRIVDVGQLAGHAAAPTLDVTGLTIAPGFIDVQGQSGSTLLADGRGESHLRQGITTEIIGEGSSPAFSTDRSRIC